MKIARDERYRDFFLFKSSVMLLSRSIRDYTNSDTLISPVLAHVSLSKDDGDGNENGKKAIGSDCKTTNLHVHHAFLCISLPSLHDYDVNFPNFTFYGGRERRQRPSFCFPELWSSPLKFNSQKIRQRLTNWTRWNKRDWVWRSANTLLNWRFRSRRRRCCLSSLITQGVNSQGVWEERIVPLFQPEFCLWSQVRLEQAGAQGIHIVSFSSKILLSFTVTTFGFPQRHSL